MKKLTFDLDVKANQKNRTFTIRKKYSDGFMVKYRTIPLNKEEFEIEEMNTENDWINFLKSDNYYIVKKYYR